MTVVHFDSNNTVDQRIVWASTVAEVVEKKLGPVWAHYQRSEEVPTGEVDSETGESVNQTILHIDTVRVVPQSALDAEAVNYAVGDYMIGSTRDPSTGVITPYVTPSQTLADRASSMRLSSPDFWIALHVALIQKGALDFDDDIQAHVLATISQAVQASLLSAAEGMAARILVKTAGTFYRADPERPGLMDSLGALLGLDSAEIDRLFTGDD